MTAASTPCVPMRAGTPHRPRRGTDHTLKASDAQPALASQRTSSGGMWVYPLFFAVSKENHKKQTLFFGGGFVDKQTRPSETV